MGGGNHLTRRSEPWLFVEFLYIANWLKDGEAISDIARRLRRPIPHVRAVVFGDAA